MRRLRENQSMLAYRKKIVVFFRKYRKEPAMLRVEAPLEKEVANKLKIYKKRYSAIQKKPELHNQYVSTGFSCCCGNGRVCRHFLLKITSSDPEYLERTWVSSTYRHEFLQKRWAISRNPVPKFEWVEKKFLCPECGLQYDKRIISKKLKEKGKTVSKPAISFW